MSETLTVQAAKDRIKIGLRELFRIRRAARYNNNPAKVQLTTEAIDALKKEHAELSGIDANTSYKIVTDGFRDAQSKLQTIIDERNELIDNLNRAKKAADAVTKVLNLFG